MNDYYDSQKNHVQLDEELSRGGEAIVYRVQTQPDLLAKIYTKPKDGYEEKLRWMIDNPPSDPNQSKGHVSIAWPRTMLFDAKNNLVGYLMPFVQKAVPLFNVFNPSLRAQKMPGFNWVYLHRAARDLVAALDALHESGYVVGDLNESNILVNPSALITIIDTDSFQVKVHERKTSRIVIYPCPVGKPEYTPPELHGKLLSGTIREPKHDRFALGVLLFQMLLEGSHPFRAKWTGSGNDPSLSEKITKGWFPYAKRVSGPISPPDNVSLVVLNPTLAGLMQKCFEEGHTNPDLRPTAADWEQALDDAEKHLVQCKQGHYYSNHQSACPQCAANQRGTQKALPPASANPKPAPTPQPMSVPAPQPKKPARKGNPALVWGGGVFLLLLIWLAGTLLFSDPDQGSASQKPPGPMAVPTIVEDEVTAPPPNVSYPVSLDEWRNELDNLNQTFGQCDGYWCFVSAGTYRIGGWTDVDDDDDNDDEATLDLGGYWVAKYPITVQQYREFINADGYDNRAWWTDNGWAWKEGEGRTQPWGWDDADYNSDTQPVIGVTWYEASAFAASLNEGLADMLTNGYQVRLPTEAEWEVACAYDGAGQRHTYPWGEQAPTVDLVDNGFEGDNSGAAPIGGRPDGAAACGAQDMVGSVWEWTTNDYGGYASESNTRVADFATGEWDVPLRGASWWNSTDVLLCAARISYYPHYDLSIIGKGFRLVLSP